MKFDELKKLERKVRKKPDDEEFWVDIPGYKGRYQINKNGSVKSLVYYYNGYKSACRNRILKPSKGRGGYLRVKLTDDKGSVKCCFVHRLVLLSFVGESSLQVNHINGIKTDNRLSNLEYVTHSGNMKHAYRIGLEKPCDNGLKKKVAMIKDGIIVKEFESIRGMCREEGFDRRCVRRVIKGEKKDYLKYKFIEL